MYRIDSRGATTDGRFTEGNPTTGTPATVLNAAWMNSVQDELVNVVQGAGLTLDKSDNDQLLEAINKLAKAQVQAIYPVGSIYMNAADNRNPALIFGFGTWVQISGRFIAGQDGGDTDFDTPGETGGSKTHSHGGSTGGTALSVDEIPSHNHIYRDRYYPEFSGTLAPAPYKEAAPFGYNGGLGANGTDTDANTFLYYDSETESQGGGLAHSHTIGSSSNVPPYFVAYIWRRTA